MKAFLPRILLLLLHALSGAAAVLLLSSSSSSSWCNGGQQQSFCSAADANPIADGALLPKSFSSCQQAQEQLCNSKGCCAADDSVCHELYRNWVNQCVLADLVFFWEEQPSSSGSNKCICGEAATSSVASTAQTTTARARDLQDEQPENEVGDDDEATGSFFINTFFGFWRDVRFFSLLFFWCPLARFFFIQCDVTIDDWWPENDSEAEETP